MGAGSARGALRLLNTSGGRVLCLAGAVDDATVQDFVRRYGREPAVVDRIEADSVTSLSMSALALLSEHVGAARWSGRPVALSASPLVVDLLDEASEVDPPDAPPSPPLPV